MTLVADNCVYKLAKRLPFVDELLIWENRRHRLSEILKFSRELKKKKYDACLIFNPSKEFNIISWLAGIPVRTGYDRKCAFLLNRRIKDKKAEGLKHEVDYNLELLRELSRSSGDVHKDSPPLVGGVRGGGSCIDIKDTDFPDAKMEELGMRDKAFIAIHPWASNPQRNGLSISSGGMPQAGVGI